MRIAEEALRASERQGQGNVYMNAGGGAASSAAAVGNAYDYRRPYKSRTVAILLAIFLGGIGGHKFYLDRAGFGILYLLFCWTLIPGFVALIEAIRYLLMGEERFHLKYG